MPTTALAAEATATANFTSGDGSAALELLNAAKTGTENSTWDADTKTLTLNGVNFTTTAAIAVKLPAGSTIVLAEGTTNTITGGNSASEDCYGIYAEGNLTISGSGTLNVTAGNASSRSCGIYAGSNTDKALTISSGTVIATGGDVSSGPSFGIYTLGYFTISGTADVTGKGGTATGDGSFGISAEKQVNISGGTVKAIGGTGIGSDGLYSGNGDIQIRGGKVEAIGGDAPKAGGSAGIFAQTSSANVTISGNADVTARGGKSASDRSYGICSINLVTISGGKVEATADEGSYYGYGIYNKAYISGGTITAASAYGEAIPNVNLKGSGYKTISFNGNGGSGHMKAYTKDGSYTLPANGFAAPDDKVFKGWKVGEEIKAGGDTIDVSGSIPTVYAQWGDVEYAVTVTGGTASPSGAQVAGTSVTITANAAPSGQVFDKWEVVSGGITLADATSATTTFTMPAEAVSVKATYKAIYAVSVTYGTASPSGAQAAGTSITITANEPAAGQQFKKWTGADGLTFTSGSKTSATATFTMPNRAVALIATYEDIPVATTHTVTFNANGGAVTPASAVTGADGKLTSLPTPTRSRYSFNGWYTKASGGTKVDTDYAFNTDTTIYAHWTSTGGGTTRYTVLFETNGGSKVSSKTVTRNTAVSEPTAPTKDGYTFDGWYSDKALKTAYDFSAKVTKSFTLYAKWTEKATEPDNPTEPTVPEWKNSFTDVKKSDWFYTNVEYAVNNKLMNGTTATTFAPSENLTRAMLIAILYRAEGEPAVNKSIPFSDVAVNAYYANAVIWAQQNGIVNGVTENAFAPDNNITREQIAAIMFRFAKYKGYDVSVGESTNILSYTDARDVSEYAVSAMQYAVGSGLMKGKTESTINPLDNATRAEIAAILQRFIEANK